jgi:hypothetical protein
MKRILVLFMAFVCITPPGHAFGWPFTILHKGNKHPSNHHIHTMPAGKAVDFHKQSQKQPITRNKKYNTSSQYPTQIERVYSSANYKK